MGQSSPSAHEPQRSAVQLERVLNLLNSEHTGLAEAATEGPATGAPASWPTETPAASPNSSGMVTGSSPWPTNLPSMNNLAIPGAPFALERLWFAGGSNSKLRMRLPLGTLTSETTWKYFWAT